MATYFIGNIVTISTTVTNGTTGALIDPATVQLTIKQPDSTVTGPFTATKDSVGLYHYDFTPTQIGHHSYQWLTTSPAVGAADGTFDVAPAYSAYCDRTDLLLGDLQLGSLDPTPYIMRASRDVDIALGERYVTPVATSNTYTANLLRNVTADLASAYLLMAQNQVTENNLPNAYAVTLWNRAKEVLDPFRYSRNLPDAPLLPTATSSSPVSLVQQDAKSLLDAYETFITTPNPYGVDFIPAWGTGRPWEGNQ